MNKTKIEWVRNPDGSPGYTWNPITGCLNGCEYCYARKLANGRLKQMYLANKNMVPFEKVEDEDGSDHWQFHDPFYPRFWEDRLVAGDAFLKSAKNPLGIFPCDMSDWCGIGIPESWSDWILEMARRYPWHRFYLLTKQPQNLIKFSPFPDNCWVGVTVTNADMLFDAINHLDDIQCSVRYLSIEPMLASCYLEDLPAHLGSTLDWVIIGALTGTKQELLSLKVAAPLTLMPYGKKWTLQPKIEWVEEIVRACDKAGIPVFLKENLKPLLEEEPLNPLFWANIHNDERGYERQDDELRQELPE